MARSRPADPALAAAAEALETAGQSAEIWDAGWRLVHATENFMAQAGGAVEHPEAGLGEHAMSTATLELRETWRAGPVLEDAVALGIEWLPFVLADTPGGRDELTALSDERFHAAIAAAEPRRAPPMWSSRGRVKYGDRDVYTQLTLVRIRDEQGRLAGTASILKPSVPAAVLAMLALGDLALFERLYDLAVPRRRPAAMLFCDLEASTGLARRLSTPAYFALVRRLARRIDASVVAAGGIVGKHIGDGVTAFFLTDPGRDESCAARACLATVSAIRADACAAAERSELDPSEVVVRLGLHWGDRVYVGRLMTTGRSEIAVLGEEVNEAARIEACATGGRALASKALVEQLSGADARALGLDPVRTTYTALGELTSATEKARRDAPAIAVCEIA